MYGLLLHDSYIQVFRILNVPGCIFDCVLFSGTECSWVLVVGHSAVVVLYLSEQGKAFGALQSAEGVIEAVFIYFAFEQQRGIKYDL